MSTKRENGKSGLEIYLRLLTYMKPLLLTFGLSIFGYFIFASTQPMIPKLLEIIIEAVEKKDHAQRIIFPLYAIAIFTARGLGSFLGNYYMAWVSGKLVQTLQTSVFDHLTTLPAHFFDTNNSGQLIGRLTNSIYMVTGAATNAVKVVLREGMTVIFLLCYIFYLNWQLSLIFILIAPLIAGLVAYASKRFRKISHKIQNIAGNVLQIASEMISGYRVMRSFGGESYEQNRFQKVCNDNFEQNMKMAKLSSLQTPAMQLLVSVGLALVIFLILDPDILARNSTAELVGYLTAVGLLPKPIRQLSEVNATIQRGIAGAEMIFEILDTPHESDTGDIALTRVRGKLTFRNVSFHYPGSEEKVLQNISVSIEPGQTVALVGRSGSGKSTLASLLPRFYEISEGSIAIDDIDIRNYRLDSLRNQIALVSQNVTLFNDTIANNIAYGALSGHSKDKVIEAAEAAYALDFINNLPLGIDTEIGENGLQLSGGQRQRLAIARALLKDAPILILDEATSALDTESEQNIQAALEKVMANRTTLVIA
ncbi:MAG: lipid A export permease/ATP-binding protein MsbA, partial [Pseudomonadales bacterium]|nr:lipid A export permease/ATP-binding protein MsbA [Pseudomonadales bacterium]